MEEEEDGGNFGEIQLSHLHPISARPKQVQTSFDGKRTEVWISGFRKNCVDKMFSEKERGVDKLRSEEEIPQVVEDQIDEQRLRSRQTVHKE